jgi:hypothetical protein
LLLALLFETGLASASTEVSHPELTPFVKNEMWVQLLGRTLFWDSIDVMADMPLGARTAETSSVTPSRPATSGVPPGRAESSGFEPSGSEATGTAPAGIARVVKTLLAHRALDKYLWLIQQGFDDSLWKGGDRSRVEQNFPLIFRISLMLYESGLESGTARLRVCQPQEPGDGLECTDETAPTRVVPIPSHTPLFGNQDQPQTG